MQSRGHGNYADQREEASGKVTQEVDGKCERRYGTDRTGGRKCKGSGTVVKENTEDSTLQSSLKPRQKMMMITTYF